MSVVIAGVDPHKRTLTVGVVDGVGVEVAVASFANDGEGIAATIDWLDQFDVPVGRVGIEGSAGHGLNLARALDGAGHDVREVPARRTAQRRRERRRPKTDREDALAIARATQSDPHLGVARHLAGPDDVHAELGAVSQWRDALVGQRKTLLNQVENIIDKLPIDLIDHLGRGRAIAPRLARAIALDDHDHDRATATRLARLRQIAGDIDDLSSRIKSLEQQLKTLVEATGSTLTEEVGISYVSAAVLLTEIGDPTRFRSEGAFSRWNGTGAVATSSGEGDRSPAHHRLDLTGNRRINSVLYVMSVVQGRVHPDAQDYLQRKRHEGKTAKEARRAHKHLLSNRIIRRMWADHRRTHSITEELPLAS